MFRKSQRFYDAVYSWKDYRTEVDRLDGLIRERHPDARTLLDVACGTGKHLELLRPGYEVEGFDLDADMLAAARSRLPGVRLHRADMVDFDLGRTFDVVTCLFSSIGYARTDDRLHRAMASMRRHLAPGGLVVVEPWFSPDQWLPGLPHAVMVDEDDLKLARINVSGPVTDPMTLTFHYMVGTPDGVEHFTEDHVMGMFTHERYVAAFRAAGLEPNHDPEGLAGRGLYVASAPT
jgi:SAM-dependent methyltransferase